MTRGGVSAAVNLPSEWGVGGDGVPTDFRRRIAELYAARLGRFTSASVRALRQAAWKSGLARGRAGSGCGHWQGR